MAKKAITISPKHGLNPTLGVCFFCGEDTGELALCGRVRDGKDNDKEMPMRTVLSYQPCDKCVQKFSSGVLLIAVQPRPIDGRPEITIRDGVHLYPTGDHIVLKAKAASRLAGQTIQPGQSMLIEQEALEKLMAQIDGSDNNTENEN